MRTKIIWVIITILLFSGISLPGAAQMSSPSSESTNPVVPLTVEMENAPTSWFVEFKSPALEIGGTRANILADRNQFQKDASSLGLAFDERRAFSTLWNGISIEIEPNQVSLLARIPSVKAIFPVLEIPLPEISPIENPEMATAPSMTGVDIAQSELNLSGIGIRIGVMDTGIDYLHPDMGGCFGTGCRVETGWDFVGDAFNADPNSTSYNPIPSPDADPMDCNGHGTHVAGIAGANAALPGGVTGVAPGVTFGAYRVFGCSGSTTSDIMLAAMERALQDEMDILNMSIGAPFQWPQYPTSVAADLLVDQGMVVVASIGNSGANGLYSAGAPGVGSKVIGVASFDNTHVELATFTVTPADITAGYANATGAPAAPDSGSLLMAKSGAPDSIADACLVSGASPFTPGQFTGNAVLIRRGICSFYEKAKNAQDAGAAAVVIYNNTSGRFTPTVAGTSPITIPVVAISSTEGVAINNAIATEPQYLNWQSESGSFPNPTGGLISSFSSYGLAPDLSLKPDLGAPGGMIRSTYPTVLGSYASMSGTSMASPHVAGAVALLLEALPDTHPEQVGVLLQNTALPKPWWGNPGLGFLDNVHRQGAGMLQIDKAITAAAYIEPSRLALGESQAGPSTYTLTVYNTGQEDVIYNLSFENALSTGPNTFAPSFYVSDASVSFSIASLPVLAGDTATVEATITPATGPVLGLYGGYLVFTPQEEGQTYRVPYAGFIGDYQAVQVLTPGVYDFPWLAYTPDGYSAYPVTTDGQVFTMDGFDVPYVFVHFHHQAAQVRLEVLPSANLNKNYDLAIFQSDYYGRNSTSTAYEYFTWDGTAVESNNRRPLPNGNYRLKLSVLKALGHPDNPDDWETWTSPSFTIARTGSWDLSVSPSTYERWGNPGSRVEHTLTITNTGTRTDTYQVLTGPSDWPVDLGANVIGPVGAGDSAVVSLEMEVPPGAMSGESSTVDINVSSLSGVETSSDTATLKVSANPVYGFSLTPDIASQSNFAGKTASYTLVLVNTGNIGDTYDLSLSGNRWSTRIEPQAAGPLLPGSQSLITVSVEVPTHPVLGSKDSVSVTAKSRANPAIQVKLTLTTQAEARLLYLPFAGN